MRKTNPGEEKNRLTYNKKELPARLGCGLHTAEKIAAEAGAVMHIGSRVLYNVSKIEKYLDRISGAGTTAEVE